MATIDQVIGRVDKAKPNAFGKELKLLWLAELEGKLAVDVFLMDIQQVQEMHYCYPEDLQTELLVKFPHDGLYDAYLTAKIDLQNGEYNKYENTMEVYNSLYGEFVRWFAKTYNPASGYRRKRVEGDPPYYISAYALAVQQGFEGSLQEWLASLNGKPVVLQMAGNCIQWKYADGEETAWQTLLDIGIYVKAVAQAAEDAASVRREADKGAFRGDQGVSIQAVSVVQVM